MSGKAFAGERLKALSIGMLWGSERSGGLDRIFADLNTRLPAHGVDVCGVVAGPADVEDRTGGRVRCFGGDQNLAARLSACRRLCRQTLGTENIDLIAAHFALYAASVLDVLPARPFVMHFHGPWAAESVREGQRRSAAGLKALLEKGVYSRAHAAIVLSRAFANLLAESYRVPEDKIHVVPGSVDLCRFDCEVTRSEARRILGWPEDRLILLTVRRLVQRTGVGLLLDALAQAKPIMRDAVLIVAGSGPLAQQLKDRAANTLPPGSVHFAGYIPDDLLPIAYRAADLNIVPSLALEGFGLTAAEALAAGTASLVTPVGGLPEVVTALSPLLVCEDVTPAALAGAITGLISGAVRLPSPEECRTYAKVNFSPELAASRTANIYRSCC